jgi:hypothetical protein
MKKIILLLLLFIINTNQAQEKVSSTNGLISFEASVPVFEAVKAINNEVKCVLNTKTGQLYFTLYINKFQFERELMKEHFNSNYLESDRYPKAEFYGIIEKFDLKNLSPNKRNYQIKGKIEIHGKTKKIVVVASLLKTEKGILLNSDFNLNTDDFKIEIPTIVIAKISKTVNVYVNCSLE